MSGGAIEPFVPYPLHPSKHRAPALFTAADFHRYVARRRGVAPPRPPRSIVLCYGGRWKRYLDRRFRGRLDVRSGIYLAGPGVGVTLVAGPGAPHSAVVVEELAALGVRRFVIVGLAGSLQPRLRAGEIVVCEKALRDEGTSYHYAPPSRFAYPDAKLASALRRVLERSGIPYDSGASWTIDAIYRETVAEVRRYRARGILTVEMEASAVFTVARALGRAAAALFVISDHLDERGWEPKFHDARPSLRRALDLAVEALRR